MNRIVYRATVCTLIFLLSAAAEPLLAQQQQRRSQSSSLRKIQRSRPLSCRRIPADHRPRLPRTRPQNQCSPPAAPAAEWHCGST